MSFRKYERYKDSGVEWLGEVPEHWDIRKVRWLCEIKKRIAGELGYDVLSITQRGIRVKDLESNDGQMSMDYSKYQFVEIGDFAMNHMDLLTGYVDIASIRGVTSPDYRVFTVRDPNAFYDKYYLYMFQMGYKNKIFYAYGQGSSQLGRWRLPTEQFNDLPFPVPPAHEQQNIAAFLDRETAKIDALIAEQEKLIVLLTEKRQAVISHAVTKGLNPKVKMKDSGIEWLGEVPEHWAVSKIGFEAWVRARLGWKGLKAEEYVEDGFIFLATPNIKEAEIDFENVNYISDLRYEESPEIKLKIGDVLLTKDGSTLGTVNIIRNLPRPATVNSSIAVITPRNRLRGLFLFYMFRSHFFQNTIQLLKGGMGVPHLFQEDLNKFCLPLPPTEEQVTISTFLDREIAKLDSLMAEAQRSLSLLQERRTALISAAVTGKVDVRSTSVTRSRAKVYA